ncbi:MAG: dihydroorotate dehydrogenase electron transfer subunit [Candidatus Bathyarchaeia archaeon]
MRFSQNIHKPRIVKIEEVKDLTKNVRLIMFKDELCKKANPGQFIMLWIPGVDEIPMSLMLSRYNKLVGVLVKKVGEATKRIGKMKVGDKIGIRGPYGKGFKFNAKKKALIIAGGVGISPLLQIMESQLKNGSTIIIGAKTKSEIIFLESIGSIISPNTNLIVATDDGSYGKKGLVSEIAQEILKYENFDVVYACGPELMIKKIFDIVYEKELQFQASLERYMKCGVGICGSCNLGPYRVCIDGPVFSKEDMKKMEEFGIYKKDSSGRRIPI